MNLDYAGLPDTLPHLRNTSARQWETMATDKTATLSFRIEPGLKETLRAAAEQEYHSIANMVEVIIRDYCARNAIGVQAPDALPKSRKPAKSRKS